MEAVLERARQREALAALRLHASGRSYEEIAEQMCYASPETAREAVKSALASQIDDDPETTKRLELYRLGRLAGVVDDVISKVEANLANPSTTDPSDPPSVERLKLQLVCVEKATKLNLQIMAHRAALLGLLSQEDANAATQAIHRLIINVNQAAHPPAPQLAQPAQLAQTIQLAPPPRQLTSSTPAPTQRPPLGISGGDE